MSDEPNITAAQTEETAVAEETNTDEGNPSTEEATGDGGEQTSESGAEASGAEEATGDGGEQTGNNDQPAAPESYADFSVPEGMELDNALVAEVTPLFKELGLSQEQAQKLVDFQAQQIQAGAQSQVDNFNQLVNEWKEQSINDKEFGGDNFEENIGVARAAIDKFGTPELSKLLNDHGVGNHPEIIRFMVKVGKLTQEDVPGGKNNPTSAPGDHVSVLYPDSKSA